MVGQLVFPFGPEPRHGVADFIAAPCNAQGFGFVANWPDWPARAAALHGPRGAGKTHLARIFQEASGAPAIPAQALAEALAPGEHAIPPGMAALVVEDVDASLADPARDAALMALFERPSLTLLFTGREPPHLWAAAIPDLRSRFDALLAFPVWAPDDALLTGLIAKHFADRQIDVPASAVRRILTHVERTPEAVAAFVARADGKAFSEHRAVSERLVMEMLEAESALGCD